MAPEMEFEWDEQKAERNFQKHRVRFTEAATVFADLLSSTFPDPDHSIEEDRYVIVGRSTGDRVLVISYTIRGERIRIISARKATRQERTAYEERN